MNQVLPYPLWIGHAGEGRDFRVIFDQGIRAIVYLAMEEAPAQMPRELISVRYPLVDGPGNRAEMLFLAVSSVATLLKMNIPTLVTCGAGMSRAPAISAAALALVHQRKPEECLQLVAKHHAHDISPGFWNEVLAALPAVSKQS